MAWSYSGDPTSSAKDAVRFLIGDTDTNDQQLQDEEILFLLAQTSNDIYSAAILACRSIASIYSRQADQRIGDYSISASQKAAAYLALAKQLEQSQTKALIKRVKPYAGGISVSDKREDEENPDRVQPAFTRRDMAFPGIEDVDYDGNKY